MVLFSYLAQNFENSCDFFPAIFDPDHLAALISALKKPCHLRRMRSPQVFYNAEKQQFEAHTKGHLDTFFVFPSVLQEGDRLPSLLMYVPGESTPFQFDGQYNPATDNLEFLFDGPPGYAYKYSLSVDPGSEVPYLWKAKKHGSTTGFDACEDAVTYVPKYMCLLGATSVEASREVLLGPTFYGTCTQRVFCTMRLKIGVVPGSRYHSAPPSTEVDEYEYIHLDFRMGDGVPEGLLHLGDTPAASKEEVEEKSLLIQRTYEVTLTADEPDRVQRRAKTSEQVRVFDTPDVRMDKMKTVEEEEEGSAGTATATATATKLGGSSPPEEMKASSAVEEKIPSQSEDESRRVRLDRGIDEGIIPAGEEESLMVSRTHEVTVTRDGPETVERKARRSEKFHVSRPLSGDGEAAFPKDDAILPGRVEEESTSAKADLPTSSVAAELGSKGSTSSAATGSSSGSSFTKSSDEPSPSKESTATSGSGGDGEGKEQIHIQLDETRRTLPAGGPDRQQPESLSEPDTASASKKALPGSRKISS